MRVPDLECRVRVEDSQVELDRFEHQAASVLAFALALSAVSYATLMLVMI
jgi:hypothetical protein